MVTTCEQLASALRHRPDGTYAPARPLAAPGMTWRTRLLGAWLVLAGRAAAVRWY